MWVLRRLALRRERLDRILGRDMRDAVVRAAHAREAVPTALDGLVEALVIRRAEEVPMGLNRHLLGSLEVDRGRHLGREGLGQKRHSGRTSLKARAYNRTRQTAPVSQLAAAECGYGGARMQHG